VSDAFFTTKPDTTLNTAKGRKEVIPDDGDSKDL
jgi:hypothetical protein